jgi:hypothetical protein
VARLPHADMIPTGIDERYPLSPGVAELTVVLLVQRSLSPSLLFCLVDNKACCRSRSRQHSPDQAKAPPNSPSDKSPKFIFTPILQHLTAIPALNPRPFQTPPCKFGPGDAMRPPTNDPAANHTINPAVLNLSPRPRHSPKPAGTLKRKPSYRSKQTTYPKLGGFDFGSPNAYPPRNSHPMQPNPPSRYPYICPPLHV